MTFLGAPDWHAPQRIGDRVLYAAYEQPGRFYVAPASLDVATQADGQPAFRLNLFLQDRGGLGLARFGLLDIRFAARFDIVAAQQAVFAELPGAQVCCLLPESGMIRLAAASALALPEAATAVQPLDIGGVGSLAMTVRLDGSAAELFLEALRRGLATILADAWIVVRGVAPRFARTVAFDPAVLRTAFLDPSAGDIVRVDHLRERLRGAMESLPIHMSATVNGDDAASFTDAFADRFIGQFGALAAPAADANGAWVRLDADRARSGEVRWNLNEPVLTPRIFALQADPLGPARGLFGPEAEAVLVRQISAPALESGWRTLSLSPNIPDGRVGVLRSTVEITVPPNPPARPQTLKATVLLDPGDRLKTVDLRLAPGEPLAFTWQTFVFVIAGTSVESIPGPVKNQDGEHITVNPDAFGVRFIPVEAEPSFLAEAVITVECSGLRGGRPWTIRGVIDKARPMLALALPADVSDAIVAATAKSAETGTEPRMPPVPAQPLRLDPFSFEGSGARRIEIRCDFDDAATEVLIECAPEDRIDDAMRRTLIRLTPASPKREWAWLALSPFRSGFRWRWLRPEGAPLAGWSNPFEPEAPLSLLSSQRFAATSERSQTMNTSIVIDGVELAPIEEQPRAYRYKPLAATVARDSAGHAQFTLIAAGPIALLSCTTMWGVTGLALEAVRVKLATQTKVTDPAQVQLVPAAVDVGPVELLLGDGSGTFTPFLSGQSSGMPPYNTAFSATLTEAQKAAVEKALGGARDYLAVRYTVQERPAASRSTETSSHGSSVTTSTFTRTTSTGTSTAEGTTSARHESDTTESSPAPAPSAKIYQADAADWGLGG